MKKEQYQKLKQLDRIEYMLAKQQVGELQINTFSFIGTILYILLAYVILVLLEWIAFKTVHMLAVFPLLIFLMRLGIIVIVVLDILQVFFHFRKLKQLDQHFSKKKGRKR